jgi:hypothetical protein
MLMLNFKPYYDVIVELYVSLMKILHHDISQIDTNFMRICLLTIIVVWTQFASNQFNAHYFISHKIWCEVHFNVHLCKQGIIINSHSQDIFFLIWASCMHLVYLSYLISSNIKAIIMPFNVWYAIWWRNCLKCFYIRWVVSYYPHIYLYALFRVPCMLLYVYWNCILYLCL